METHLLEPYEVYAIQSSVREGVRNTSNPFIRLLAATRMRIAVNAPETLHHYSWAYNAIDRPLKSKIRHAVMVNKNLARKEDMRNH